MKEKNEPKRLKNSLFHDKLDYCWFSHEVIKNSHREFSMLLSFFFHEVLEQLKTNIPTNLRKGSSLLDAASLEWEGGGGGSRAGRRDFVMCTVVIY